eukprot:7891726-Alexandrium_andersonii.AAC.1
MRDRGWGQVRRRLAARARMHNDTFPRHPSSHPVLLCSQCGARRPLCTVRAVTQASALLLAGLPVRLPLGAAVA